MSWLDEQNAVAKEIGSTERRKGWKKQAAQRRWCQWRALYISFRVTFCVKPFRAENLSLPTRQKGGSDEGIEDHPAWLADDLRAFQLRMAKDLV